MSLLLTCAFAGTVSTAQAQEYPFSLPADFEASISIDETKTEPVNNGIMGVNMTSVRAFASNQGFADADTRTIVAKVHPASMRFPGGAPTNTYNFRNDTDNPARPEKKVGVDGLIALSKELGMEVMWTFNVTKDNASDAVENLAQLRARGAKVENIELGNELFWGQEDRVALNQNVREIAAALHKVRSEPENFASDFVATRRGQRPDESQRPQQRIHPPRRQNRRRARHGDYFDAITVHRYIHKAGRSPKEGDPAPTPNDYKDLLTAGKNILDDTAGEPRRFRPRQTGVADRMGREWRLFRWRQRRQLSWRRRWLSDDVQQSGYLSPTRNWFQVNSYDEFLRATRDPQTQKLNVTTTGFLHMFEIVQHVFRDSQLLGGDVAAPWLIPVSPENPNGSQAISAKATMKDGVMKILAVNKTDKDVRFSIFNGKTPRPRKYRFETLKYNGLSDEGALPALDLSNDKPSPLQTEVLLPGGTGDPMASVVLPRFSMSIISDSQ